MSSTKSAENLIKACQLGQFPLLQTQVDCGLTDLDIFQCYCTAIKNDNISAHIICQHLKNNSLGEFILTECPPVKKLKCYDTVVQNGGIKTQWDRDLIDCSNCDMYQKNTSSKCLNCESDLKKTNV